ncbi:expressed unknown protein [Seminavis robusta]|uniref:Uncharacterized protein n=1 Tax=Seminavis robusta TaxID=568900 RepID=A0A9N8HB10_9STRA|nr:expressed unknown protein [Seminavis robusta]|eukprot:Sro343_g121880.1 n/a (737) ;mRNA; f:6342-8552
MSVLGYPTFFIFAALIICGTTLEATHGAVSSSALTPSLRRRTQQHQRQLPDHTDDPNVWGVQSGPATGDSDAGGMIYDMKHDSLVLVGTTHDADFFHSGDNPNSVDCFIATVQLPPVVDEIAEREAGNASDTNLLQPTWEFTALHRVATNNLLDRCDLVTAQQGDFRKRYFSAGTLAVRTDTNQQARAVHPFMMELNLAFFDGVNEETSVTTSNQFKVLDEPIDVGNNPLLLPINNDIILPSASTSDRQFVYLATIDRVLVTTQVDTQVRPVFRLDLGISKFLTTDNPDDPFSKVWSRIYPTSIVEMRNDGVPHVTSGLFHPVPGMPPGLSDVEIAQSLIEEEMEQLEQPHNREEEMDLHWHEYGYDAVLITGLELIQTEEEADQYLLIAGSAPGTQEAIDSANSNQTLSGHPFLNGRATHISDWDGFVAKVRADNGQTLRPPDQGTNSRPVPNTWSFKLASQPRRNDFIQSICTAKVHPILNPYIHNVAYVVGTTQGKLAGDRNGGAVIIKLDLQTMNAYWKRQIPGFNVQGLSCQVLVDVPSYGTTIEAESRDLLYVAGEVHGHMTVELADGRQVNTDGHGETDIWVAQMRASDGKINWLHQIGTSNQDRLAKNVNNPMLTEGRQEVSMGQTGSGKGALALDRHGNAIVYGTTTGSLARSKDPGDRIRDIFVLRLHRDDGSFRAILPPPNYVEESPISTSGGTSTPAPTPNAASSISRTSRGGGDSMITDLCCD